MHGQKNIKQRSLKNLELVVIIFVPIWHWVQLPTYASFTIQSWRMEGMSHTYRHLIKGGEGQSNTTVVMLNI